PKDPIIATLEAWPTAVILPSKGWSKLTWSGGGSRLFRRWFWTFRRRVPVLRIAAALGPAAGHVCWPLSQQVLQWPTIGPGHPAQLRKIRFGKSHSRDPSD